MIIRKKKILTLALIMVLIMSQFSGLSAYAGESGPEKEVNEELPDTGNNDAELLKSANDLSAGELAFNGMYIQKHFDEKYISKVDLSSVYAPVSYMRSNAAYTRKAGKELYEGVDMGNIISTSDYATYVYDVDPDSKYYVALPDVNMGSDEFQLYHVDVIYNNNSAEFLEGVHFDKETSILYIPKSYIDSPDPREELFDERGPVAIQVCYKMDLKTLESGDLDFGKRLPMVAISTEEGDRDVLIKDIDVNNMFDLTTMIPGIVRDPGEHDKKDFHIFLNGMFVPLEDSQYSYDKETGDINIAVQASTLSSVMVMVDENRETWYEKLMSVFAEKAFAADDDDEGDDGSDPQDYEDDVDFNSLRGLKVNNKYVYVNNDDGDLFDKMYVGWRGTYGSNDSDTRTTVLYGRTNRLRQDSRYLKDAEAYLYTTSTQGKAWAVISYTLGRDVVTWETIDIGDVMENSASGSTRYASIFEHMDVSRKNLVRFMKRTRTNSVGNVHTKMTKASNVLTFAFRWPSEVKKAGNLNPEMEDAPEFGVKFEAEGISRNEFLPAWCRHFDTAGPIVQADTLEEIPSKMFMACIGKGTDEGGNYLIMSFGSYKGARIDNNEQTGGAVYKIYTDRGGKFRFTKASMAPNVMAIGGSAYSLKGAEYTLYEDSELSTKAKDTGGSTVKLTTGDDGKSNTSSYIEQGAYYLKETKASPGHVEDTGVYKVKIVAGETVEVTSGGGALIEPLPENVEIKTTKVDADTGSAHPPQGNASLRGAEFTFEYRNVDTAAGEAPVRKWIFKTIDDTGTVSFDEAHFVSAGSDPLPRDKNGALVIPIGTYKIKETKAPLGYNLSAETVTCIVTQDGDKLKATYDRSVIRDPVKRFDVKLQKNDNDLSEAYSQGKASLAGAEFTITNMSQNDVVTRNTDVLSNAEPAVNWADNDSQDKTKRVAKGKALGVIRTDTNGKAASTGKSLSFGTYEIRETKPGTGYKLNGKWKFTVRAYIDGTSEKIEVTGVNNDDGQVTKEVLNFTDGMTIDLSKYAVREPVIRSGIQLIKRDKELGKSEAMGGANLNDIIFAVKNVSSHDVVVRKNKVNVKDNSLKPPLDAEINLLSGDAFYNAGTSRISESERPGDTDWIKLSGKAEKFDKEIIRVAPGEDVGHIISHWNEEKNAYTAETRADDLPYGEYEVREVVSNRTYLQTDRTAHRFTVTEDGVIYGGSEDDDTFVFDNFVYRGHIRIQKKSLTSQHRLSYVPFKVTNKATNESHIFLTDEQGNINSNVGSKKGTESDNDLNTAEERVNPFDDLDGAEEEELTKERLSERVAELEMPVWFSKGEFGSDAPYDPDYGALPYGEYEVEELRCESNSDFRLNEFTISVTQRSQNWEYDPYEIENMEKPSISTSAAVEGESQGVSPDESLKLTDTIYYHEFEVNKKYKAYARLVDKDTGESVKDPEGNEVTAEQEFTAMSREGSVDVTFSFDARNLYGKSVVAFERVFSLEEGKEIDPESDEPYAVHEDIEDEAQTVVFEEPRPGYEMNKVRKGEAPLKEDGKYGFRRGDTVSYEVHVKNTGNIALTMVVSDDFAEGAEYFTEPVVAGVEGADWKNEGSDERKAGIYLKKGGEAVVTFTAVIKETAAEYLAGAALDSDSLDKEGKSVNRKDKVNDPDDNDGYKNLARVTDVYPDKPDGPETPDEESPGDPEEDDAQTPVQVGEPEPGETPAIKSKPEESETNVVKSPGKTSIIKQEDPEITSEGEKISSGIPVPTGDNEKLLAYLFLLIFGIVGAAAAFRKASK